jgi:AcrR family transcriptional regulator
MSATAVAKSGRPLDEELSAAILDATLRVLAREGYGGLSIAAVAEDAGVHRPAIYRRWASKPDLVVAALERLKPTPSDPATGDVRTDLVAYLVGIGCGSDQVHALALQLQGDLAIHADLHDAVDQQLAVPRRTRLRTILCRGVDAGQLRADLDPDLAVDLVLGAVQSRKLQRRPALRPADVERYVELLVTGLGAPPPG